MCYSRIWKQNRVTRTLSTWVFCSHTSNIPSPNLGKNRGRNCQSNRIIILISFKQVLFVWTFQFRIELSEFISHDNRFCVLRGEISYRCFPVITRLTNSYFVFKYHKIFRHFLDVYDLTSVLIVEFVTSSLKLHCTQNWIMVFDTGKKSRLHSSVHLTSVKTC